MSRIGHLIVIPAHDEAATLAAVVEEARRHGPVLVVDDGSRDGTADIARASGAEVLRHPERLGKAAALRSGFAAARARGAARVVTLDGDGQHDPGEIPALLAAAVEAPDAIVIGRRITPALPPERSNAARMAGFFVSWASGTTLADTQCGFRVYPVALLDALSARRGGFVFETEILVEALRAGARVVEVAVRTRSRATARSRFRPMRDGVAIAVYLAGPTLARWGTEVRAAARGFGALFSAERRRARHSAILEAAAPYVGSPAWGAAVGASVARRAAERARGWWRQPRRHRAAAAGTLAAPGVLALLALQALGGRRFPDVVTPLVEALYSAERLAPVVAAVAADYDVVVIGGGPGGAAAATHLARAGLSVAVFEREVFPRAHVGESLMPATMVLLERLGARERVEASGFQIKYGASFHEAETGHIQTFYFLQGMPWPNYSYQVPRAEFDTILLDNARKHGVTVCQPETVDDAEFDRDGVTLTVSSGDARRRLRARFLVDASGRLSFMAMRAGGREQIPNLGKVALWAHWKGAPRVDGRAEGNIRVYLGEEGWFWWIPLANDLTSIGAVCHARTVRAFDGTPDALYAQMIRRSPAVAEGLAGATRVTEIHREANFAYFNEPVRGDRFLAVGDAIAFVDPIFSGGVFIALWSGELAAAAIVRAFRAGRFGARRFRAYERRVRARMAPLFTFIHKYYEPAFMQIFLRPRNFFGAVDGVLSVLSGGSFIRMTWRARLGLAFFFAVVRINVWVRRRAGLPVESRLEW